MYLIGSRIDIRDEVGMIIIAAVKDNKLNSAARKDFGLLVGDVFLLLTSLVIGILGTLNIIPGMPPVASYVLYGVSGCVALSWMINFVLSRSRVYPRFLPLLEAAFELKPEEGLLS